MAWNQKYKEKDNVVFIHDHVKLDQAFGCFFGKRVSS